MKMCWVLGWAVPQTWFAPLVYREFGDAEHCFIEADEEARSRLADVAADAWVVGYSLGAQLVLAAANRARFGRVSLLAPIFAFPKEEGLGGRIARTQVRYLARAIRRDPRAALADFYLRAGLDVRADQMPWTGSEKLLWGLGCLENERVEPPPPPGWELWCGRNDPLLDAERLSEIAPQTRAIAGTHHPAALIHAMAEAVR